MKQLLETLKSARKVEILIIAVVLSMLAVLCLGRDTGSDACRSDEIRMQQILSRIEGAGSVSVMIAGEENEPATGVVVASAGAGDVHVMLELQRAVQALTGLDLDKIEIVKSGR